MRSVEFSFRPQNGLRPQKNDFSPLKTAFSPRENRKNLPFPLEKTAFDSPQHHQKADRTRHPTGFRALDSRRISSPPKRFSWGIKMNFQEILEEKMTSTTPKSSLSHREIGATDPAHLSFLLGRVGIFHFRSRVGPHPFPSTKTSDSKSVTTPDHHLDERQRNALQWFSRWHEVLPLNFEKKQLKGAFRRLARRLHPDTGGGGARYFLELKDHYAHLNQVFREKP